MNVILHITSGPAAGRRIRLKSGQVARFGRTEWADFSFPHDRQMADVHFALECLPQGCRLRHLNGGGTLLDGEPVAEAALHSGCRITAGETMFEVLVEGEPARAGAVPGDAAAVGQPETVGQSSAADLCIELDLSDDARSLLAPEHTPEHFLDLLSASELYADAVRCLARWLPMPAAVLWASRCVRDAGGDALSAAETSALEAAECWVAEPDEDRRRAAERAAEAAGLDRAAGWVAQAAFWSGGSLSAPGQPEVPPPPHLTGQAVTAALLLSAGQGEPAGLAGRYQTILENGRKLARGA